jgi:cytochrome oxidase Cu insertion factor (SCO1/SenC/PrrC family)
MSRALLAWLAVLLVVMGATGIWLGVKYAGAGSRVGSQAGSYAEVDPTYLKQPADASQKWLEEFTLTDQIGRRVRSQDLAGQVYVTNFFFSSCPGTCLQQNQKILEIAGEYGPQGVRFLSITCDPEIDDPQRLAEYGSRLGADPDHWSFLTGQLLYTRRIASEIYEIGLDKQTHSERFFVTDKWGQIRGQFAWNQLDQITDMRLLLDKLLAEKERSVVSDQGSVISSQ